MLPSLMEDHGFVPQERRLPSGSSKRCKRVGKHDIGGGKNVGPGVRRCDLVGG